MNIPLGRKERIDLARFEVQDIPFSLGVERVECLGPEIGHEQTVPIRIRALAKTNALGEYRIAYRGVFRFLRSVCFRGLAGGHPRQDAQQTERNFRFFHGKSIVLFSVVRKRS